VWLTMVSIRSVWIPLIDNSHRYSWRDPASSGLIACLLLLLVIGVCPTDAAHLHRAVVLTARTVDWFALRLAGEHLHGDHLYRLVSALPGLPPTLNPIFF
jgi:hypothetical protein